jgi:hypothetical protein
MRLEQRSEGKRMQHYLPTAHSEINVATIISVFLQIVINQSCYEY